jgi:O-antigen/teichoic acid export membrane protein
LTSRLPLYAAPFIFVVADSCLPGAVELCSGQGAGALRATYLRMLRLSAAAATAIGLVAVWCNAPFVRLWVGEQNFGGITMTCAFAAILFYRVQMRAASIVVIGTGRLRGVVLMSLAEAGLNLLLSVWWGRRFGPTGVAAATAVAGVLTSGWFVTRVVARELEMSAADYLRRAVVVPLASAVPAVLVGMALHGRAAHAGWIGLVALAGGVAATYALSYIVFGLSGSERSGLIERLIRARPILAVPPRSV